MPLMRRFNKCAEGKIKASKMMRIFKNMNKKKTSGETQINSHASTMQNVIRLKCIWRINGQARRNNPIKICWIGVIFWTFVMPLNGIFEMVLNISGNMHWLRTFAKVVKKSIVKRSINMFRLFFLQMWTKIVQTLSDQSSNYWWHFERI